MRKVLFVASTSIHIINFHEPYLEWFSRNGFKVHVACSGELDSTFVDKHFDIKFSRSPISLDIFSNIKTLKKLIKDSSYDLIHCHTPVASFLTRYTAWITGSKSTVMYTAHGFHFFKGAPIKNWLLYFPAEYMASLITDYLITINKEDFERAKKYFKPRKAVCKTNGIGINPDRIAIPNRDSVGQIQKEIGIKDKDVVFIYIAEMIPRKNHRLLIEACKRLKDKTDDFKLLLLGGESKLGSQLRSKINMYGLADNVHIMGYRKDIGSFIHIADIGVSVSLQEGLPIGIAEVNLLGKPIIVSNIRGHDELVVNGENGYLFELDELDVLVDYMYSLTTDKDLLEKMGNSGKEKMQKFTKDIVKDELISIYKKAVGV